MNFIDEKLEDYALESTTISDVLLDELYRETYQKVLNPRMISSALQGRFFAMLSNLCRPYRILEIGTYTGYATLCLAEGLAEQGQIHTIDHNEELLDIQNKYFERSPYRQQIKQHLGKALELIGAIDESFDLVFIDADKSNYINYFNAVLPKMNKGGLILSDNVLWSGKVLEIPNPKDIDTKCLIAYNEMLAKHPKVQTVLLPVRDGLSLARVL